MYINVVAYLYAKLYTAITVAESAHLVMHYCIGRPPLRCFTSQDF